MEHTNKFSGKAEGYAKFRPDYPDQLIIDWKQEHGLNEHAIIADIGAGTGIMTKKLLDFNLQVVAVEPNADMRAVAEEKLRHHPRYTSINGTAEHTTLPSETIDFITVAQAFHWFDLKKFKAECKRILKPSGKVAIISNSRVIDVPIMQEIISIYDAYCPEFKGFSNGMEEHPELYQAFFANFTTKSYDHPLIYDKESFIGRHLSASYAPIEGDAAYEQVVAAFRAVFEKYSTDGEVVLPNVTVCRCGELGSC
ncbi:class I SAM-dependent methyltransferase [Caldibacillus lycopersici]|uniref:Class I SAM-dependent methyltransferase n=1 Tax=Perspicuibacillus lycopersici TaxID=1325689 RepID=A0AAE3IW99_9BACI|nr:class I SAM-dependent methyltransferase [Perspicuibacillus lycopersici]MCU9613245.1 class I SAM-dependent methyltransferase [Perspicuibacillus lycopersici]